MAARFAGGAAGSALGACVWAWAMWTGVSILCLGLTAAAFLVLWAGLKSKHGVACRPVALS